MRIVDLTQDLDLDRVDGLVAAPETMQDTDSRVVEIVNGVRDRGDEALCEYSKQFDGYTLTPGTMRVSRDELRQYASGADDELVGIIRSAVRNIRDFHEHQKQESWEYYAGDGVRLGMRITPIESAGVYVPGGKAAYPSSVLMNVIPAQVAGVSRIAVVTPPRSLEDNPLVAAAIELLEINEVYRVGGAQAIAALAYGTASIPKTDKITGPGNQYVQAAKRLVYGTVDIDMIAGPSEVGIIADETCDPAWAAADLLAQAEHDEMAGVWLICWSRDLAAAVFDQVQAQLETLDRNVIARTAIINNGLIFVVKDENDAVRLLNHLAPEHAEVLMAEPDSVADRIRNAGAVFVGRYSPTAIGDYFAGPNHVLPTGRTSRFFSVLGVHNFEKRSSIVRYSGRAIELYGEMIEKFAISEGLTGHGRSVSVRRR